MICADFCFCHRPGKDRRKKIHPCSRRYVLVCRHHGVRHRLFQFPEFRMLHFNSTNQILQAKFNRASDRFHGTSHQIPDRSDSAQEWLWVICLFECCSSTAPTKCCRPNLIGLLTDSTVRHIEFLTIRTLPKHDSESYVFIFVWMLQFNSTDQMLQAKFDRPSDRFHGMSHQIPDRLESAQAWLWVICVYFCLSVSESPVVTDALLRHERFVWAIDGNVWAGASNPGRFSLAQTSD